MADHDESYEDKITEAMELFRYLKSLHPREAALDLLRIMRGDDMVFYAESL